MPKSRSYKRDKLKGGARGKRRPEKRVTSQLAAWAASAAWKRAVRVLAALLRSDGAHVSRFTNFTLLRPLCHRFAQKFAKCTSLPAPTPVSWTLAATFLESCSGKAAFFTWMATSQLQAVRLDFSRAVQQVRKIGKRGEQERLPLLPKEFYGPKGDAQVLVDSLCTAFGLTCGTLNIFTITSKEIYEMLVEPLFNVRCATGVCVGKGGTVKSFYVGLFPSKFSADVKEYEAMMKGMFYEATGENPDIPHMLFSHSWVEVAEHGDGGGGGGGDTDEDDDEDDDDDDDDDEDDDEDDDDGGGGGKGDTDAPSAPKRRR